ncbi:MAG: lytic transglycosylase domain-containing protein [Acidobacteria bacterium]|nr:lytic transglycosylase domain-containing protein [Acidobacteriota bacterium]
MRPSAGEPAPSGRRSNRGYVVLGAATLACLWAGIEPAWADERVILQTRQALVVRSVTIEAGSAILDFGGGNTMRIPEASIREIRPIAPDPAPPAPEPNRVSWQQKPWYPRVQPYESLFLAAAKRHGVEPELIVSVAHQESRFDPFAISPKGAQGLMQLMPATASTLQVDDPFDPAQNIEGGTKWLKRLLDLYAGDLDLALAAYNAGEKAVERYGGIPPFRETQDYVRTVRETYQALRPVPPQGG